MTDQYQTVSDFFKAQIKIVDDEGEQARVRRIREWVTNWKFFRGEHYGGFDQSGRWQTLPDEEMEDLRYTDDFMFYIEAKATQWSQSSPEMSIEPGSDSNIAKGASRHSEKEFEVYQDKYWTATFQHSMAKYAMLSTIYFINTRAKINPNSQVSLPKFTQKQISAPQTFYCENCGAAISESKIIDKCPDCGGDLASTPSEDINAFIPSGMQSFPEIDYEVELVDPIEMKIDPKARAGNISQSDWLRRERYIRDYEVKAMYPDWKEGAGGKRSEVLDYQASLQQSLSGWKVDQTESNRNLRRQYWFNPNVYRFYEPQADSKYANQNFAAKKKLIALYPEGVYIDQINGEAQQICGECKEKSWVAGVDTVDPTSPYGRGFSGLRNIQEMKDEGISLGFACLMRSILGTGLYDPMMVESSDVEHSRVGAYLPLKTGAQIEGRSITQAMLNVPYPAVNAPFLTEFLAALDESMPRAAGGAYNVLGGGQGTGAGQRTFSGQAQQLQTSAGMIGPALQLRADVEVEAFYQYLELRQKASDQSLVKIAGSWGDADIKAFKQCNIREDIKIHPVPNSEIPRTQMDRRNDVALAIQSGIANPQLPLIPGVRKYGLEQLRIPIEDDPDEQSRRVAEALLEKMKQAAKYVQGMIQQTSSRPDFNTVAQGIAAVAPLVKQRDQGSLPIFKEVFQEFLRSAVESDEGIDADPALHMAVTLKIDEIEEFDIGLAADMSAKQTLAQAPGAIAQNLLAQGQQQPQQPSTESATQAQQDAAQMDQNEDQALLATHQAGLEQSAADAQRQHDAEQAALGREHELKLAQIGQARRTG